MLYFSIKPILRFALANDAISYEFCTFRQFFLPLLTYAWHTAYAINGLMMSLVNLSSVAKGYKG